MNRYMYLLIIPIPFNERSGVCPFCIKIGHYFQKYPYPQRGMGIFIVDGGFEPIQMQQSGGHFLARGRVLQNADASGTDVDGF